MLDMDQVTSIRHAVLVLGRSRRWASRNFKVARETVDRYLAGAVPGKRKSTPRAAPKRAEAAAALAEVIAETKVAKKQQLTVQRAHELVREKGIDVGYTLIKQLVRERRRQAQEVFVPLTYKPGDLGEVDFFEVEVDVDGVRTTAWLFVMRLMFSSRDFTWIYPRQDQVCFLDGHVRAFAYFKCVPTRLAYDNLKAAVLKHLVGSERELQVRFAALAAHYTFEACFCRPYEGHDKGGVEARGKNVRLQSMVPIPSATTMQGVSTKVLADVERRAAVSAAKEPEDRWAIEQAAMHALPAHPFDPRKTDASAPVSPRSTVTIEGATYSVLSSWARLGVTTHAGVDEVEIIGPDGVSSRRARVPKGKSDIDYASHYLTVLSKKPQAVRQVADVLMAQLGSPFPQWWSKLVDDEGARAAARLMARILRGVVDLGREEAERRVAHAFTTGEPLNVALLVAVEPTGQPMLLVPRVLDIEVESSSLAGFDELITMTGGAA
jgi:transposase